MTNTVPDDSVDPTADQQARRPDELEDWLTDLRVTLNDPPDWLTPQDDTADPAPEPAAPPPAEDHPLPDAGTPPHSAPPEADLKDERPARAVGRHRAAE